MSVHSHMLIENRDHWTPVMKSSSQPFLSFCWFPFLSLSSHHPPSLSSPYFSPFQLLVLFVLCFFQMQTSYRSETPIKAKISFLFQKSYCPRGAIGMVICNAREKFHTWIPLELSLKTNCQNVGNHTALWFVGFSTSLT